MKKLKQLDMQSLTTEQKLGMLLCARTIVKTTKEEEDYIIELIRNHSLGCIQASWQNTALMERVIAEADYPIIIITDMEMGCPGSKLPPIPMMTLSACDEPEYYRAFARAVVSEAKQKGYNSVWSPVIDVLDGDGPCRVFRTFSDDPDRVARAGEALCQVFVENGFLPCGKHFPGGSHEYDSHMTDTGSYDSVETLLNVRLKPYFHLMQKNLLPSIMVAHSIHVNVDPELPASLSKNTIDLIRDRGYDGLIFTDDFGMMAILQKYGEENVLGMAVAAGNDIVLPNYRSSTRKSFELLKRNYADGAFTEERLNDAVRHVLQAQAIIASGVHCPDPFTAEDLAIFNSIAKDCITAITDPGVEAALPADNTDRLFVIVTNKGNFNTEPSQETITRDWYHPEAIEQKIREEFPEAEVIYLPEYPTSWENEKVLVAATRHKEVVFVTYCTTRPFLGTDCLTRRVESVINALIHSKKVSAVLHFGNPFALQPIRHVSRRLFGYMMPQSQLHAIEVLAGKLPARGKLPYNVRLD